MRNMGLTRSLIVLTMMQLAGCAGGENTSTSHEQPAVEGRGPGMHQGPPGSHNSRELKPAEQEFPDEAFSACAGKKTGERVTYIGSRNETIRATCTEYHDHLVAVPDDMEHTNSHH